MNISTFCLDLGRFKNSAEIARSNTNFGIFFAQNWLIRVMIFVIICCCNTSIIAQNPVSGGQGFQIMSEGNLTFTGAARVLGPVYVGANMTMNLTGTADINYGVNGTYIYSGDGAVTTGLNVTGNVIYTAGIVKVGNGKLIHIGNPGNTSASGDNGTNAITKVYPSTGSYASTIRIDGSVDQTPTPAVFQNLGMVPSTLFNTFRTNSLALANCANNVQLVNTSNVAISGNTVSSARVVRINSLATGANTLNLTTASLNNITELNFTSFPSATNYLIINVPITANLTWVNPLMTSLTGATHAPYIIWNFYGNSTFTVTSNSANAIVGTIFMPNQNYTKSGTGVINGGVYAKILNLASGIINYNLFAPNYNGCSCNNVTTAGTIGSSQTICAAGKPTSFTSSAPASGGGIMAIQYQWQSSPDNSVWTDISGGTALTFAPAEISSTTHYRRKARRAGCTTYLNSNPITVTINPFLCTDALCQVYSVSSTNIPVTIPSSVTSTTTSTINITRAGYVSDLDLSALNITHTYIRDLTITLTSPSGTIVTILNPSCIGNANLNLSFSDESATTTVPCPPTTGATIKPVGLLSAFDNQSITGIWTLTVVDASASDGGTINSWGLNFALACPIELCSNGIDDDNDGLIDCVDSECNSSVTLSTPVVSACINQPLQDIATVSVIATWTSAPVGGRLKISHDNKTEIINVNAGVTSPQTVVFNVLANGSSGNIITASWDVGSTCSVASAEFSKPVACSSDQINCNILYLCGNAKPADSDAWDHGLMGYVMSQNSGSTSAAVTKTDASGYGLYDVNSPSTLLSINLDNYGMIIISSSTEGYVSNGLIGALKGYKGSILNMNYLLVESLGYSASAGYYNWQTNAYTTVLEDILNYDNSYPSPTYGYLFTEGDYYSNADAFLWHNSAAKTSNLGGIYFSYDPHENTNISSTHGKRTYLGFHPNGIYQNSLNGGAMPVPPAYYFAPHKHLTVKGKELLDSALKTAATCMPEVCSNGTDDDGDGLVDCLDPNCNDLANGEFDNGTTNWNLYVQGGAASTMSTDATKQLSGSNSVIINTTTTTGTEWHVQLAQTGKSIVLGKTYKVSFRAKASANRNASVAIQLGIDPWTSYFYNTFALTTTSQNYSFEFTSNATITNNVNFMFNLASVTGTVWLDQVEFKEVCPPPSLSCGAQCPSQNTLVNGSFTTTVNGWTPSGISVMGTGGAHGNYLILNNADAAGPFTVYQDYTFGANKQFLFNGYAAKHSSSNNAKVYLEFYNSSTYLSKTADFNVTKNFDNTFQPITPVLGFTPPNTTKIRVVGYCAGTAIVLDELSIKICDICAEICTNGIDDDADGLIDCVDPDCSTLVSNAGSDQSQCMNGAFRLIGNNPAVGQTGLWSIVSGSPLLTAPLDNDSILVSLISGQTATLRWTITKNGCTSTDDIIITNNTGCSTICVDGLNSNGDLENEGTATNFNLSFQGTPALLINPGTSPQGWTSFYGTSATNTSTFQGAYYIKKTAAQGNPHSGTHMIYSGGDFCFSPYNTNINVTCGKTYKISLWAAAYTNGSTQYNSPFAIEFAAGGSSLPMPSKSTLLLNAPASNSWNALNWQRYEMFVTIPSGSNFEWANFYITTSHATQGIVVDDVCITEMSSGSDAKAGIDQFGCTNVFTLAANIPPLGYTGTWSVINGFASLSSTTDPNATATVTSGTTATLAWTVTSGGACSDVDNVVIGFANGSLSVNNQTICSGASATLTAAGCTTGALLWSNGATTSSISVSPASTTSYSVTCTPPTSSGNLALNSGFESSTNMQNWDSWGGTYGVTTVPSELRTGTKAVKINATTDWAGIGQTIAAIPNEYYTLKFWAKATNTNVEPIMQYRFVNSAYVGLVNWTYIPITSTSYQEYTITSTSPLNSAFLEYGFSVGTSSILFVDDVSITKVNNCTKSVIGTVTVNAVPTITGITPASRCGTGPVYLSATASTGTINWYTSSSGGASLGSGSNFTTPSISNTTTYYVDAINGTCISARTAVTATVTNNCSCPITTFSVQVGASDDDAEEDLSTNVVNLTSTDIELGLDGPVSQMAGLRFADIMIPKNATIVNAYLEFDTDEIWSNTSNLTIQGQAVDNASAFQSTNNNLTSRVKTTASVAWSPSGWNTLDQKQTSVDIKNILQELINRSGWQMSNDVALFVSGTGTRAGKSFDGQFYSAPKLWISYENCQQYEICNNNIDDDGDGLIDCNDSECFLGDCLTSFNFVSFGPVNVSHSDIQGKVLYCDDVNLANYSIGSKYQVGGAEAIVYTDGDFTMNNGAIQGGSILATGNVSLSQVTNEIGNPSAPAPMTIQQSTSFPVSCAVEKTYFESLTNTMEILPTNGTFTISGSDKIFNCNNLSGTVVFNISLASDPYIFTYGLAYMTNHNNAQSIVINITHADPVFHSVNINESIGLNSHKIIWNFPNATRIRMSAIGWRGTVLAPYAKLVMENGYIDGNIITNGFVMNDGTLDHPNGNAGEFHACRYGTNCGVSTYYTGTLPTTNYSGCTFHFPDTPVLPDNSICVGETIQLYPNTGVTWTSSNASVASITNVGLVTGVSAGSASFTYADTGSGCVSSSSAIITVSSSVIASISGNVNVCTGGSSTFTASGGVTYLWSTGATTAAINVNIAGTYAVTVTNAGGCIATATRTLTINSNPFITIAGTNSICSGSNTTFTGSGGSSYIWSNGNTTPSIIITLAGVYTVTATNVNGCTGTANRTLTVNSLPNITIAGTNVICSSSNSTFTASGGNNYNWNTGATTASINISLAGSYSVTVVDAYGCVSNANRTLTVNTNPTAFIGGSNTICDGANSIFTASGGSTYIWSSGATTPAINVNAAGTYSVTTTDGNGCTGSTSRALTVNALPSISVGGINSVCTGFSSIFTANGGSTYLWNTGATSAAINVNTAATYTVTATDGNGCTGTANRALTINAVLTPTITGTMVICSGSSSTFTASGGSTYVWSTGAMTPSINVNTAATYAVTATDVNGCTGVANRTLSLNAVPTPSISGTNIICAGTSTIFTASGASTYLWSSGATTAAISVNTAGVYSVTATDVNGCIGVASRNLTLNASPTISINGINSICTGGSSTFTASGASTYLWSSGATTAAISVNTATTFTVTATDGNGCTAIASRTLTINANPTAAVSGTNIICAGANTTFTASGGTTYQWSTGQTGVAIVVSVAGGYNVTVTNGAGCTSVASRTLTVNALPTPMITGADNICAGNSTTYAATGGLTYLWSTSQTTANITVSTAATYAVTATNASGCTASTNKSLTVNTLPSISVSGVNSICGGASTTFVASGASTYVWSSGENVGTINVPTAGTYTVTGTNAFGCSSTAQRVLTILPLPNITSITPSCTGAILNSVTVNANITAGTLEYRVNGGTWQSNPSFNSLSPGNHTFEVRETTTLCTTSSGLEAVDCQCSMVADNIVSGNQSICPNDVPTIITGLVPILTPTAPFTYQWQSAPSGSTMFTNISGANSKDYTPNALSVATDYRRLIILTGCPNNLSNIVTINMHSLPSITISGANELCAGSAASFVANGGVTYLWSTGSNNTSIAPSIAAIYTVTATDANGCTGTSNTTLSYNPRPIADITGVNSICIGNTTTFSGAGGIMYDWSTTENTQNILVNTAGTYTVTVTNNFGCTSSTTRTLTVNSLPSAIITGIKEICAGQSSTFTGSGGQTFLWSTGENTASIPVYSAGPYSVTVTDINGCTDTESRILDISPLPNVNITGENNICNGSTTTFAATGGSTYVWSTGATTSNININTAGTYTVTVTNIFGCTATSFRELTMKSNPIASITGDNRICAGENTTFIALGGSTYVWNTGSVSNQISPNTAGTYTVTVTGTNGCTASTADVLLIDTLPIPTIMGNGNICTGSSTTFVANNGATYLWNNGATTASISVSGNGTYYVTATDANGCSGSSSKSLVATPGFTAGVDFNGSVCLQSNSQLTAINNGGAAPYIYQWSGPAGFNASAQTVAITQNGNYYVTITDAGGCIASTSGFVYANFQPFVISVQSTICEGSSITLNAGGTGASTYLWGANAGNSTSSSVSVIPSYPSSTYIVTVTNSQGCATSASIDVAVTQRPNVSINGPSSVCLGSNSTATSSTSGTWVSVNPSVAIILNTGQIYSVGPGNATFIFTDNATGCSSLNTTTFTVHNLPSAGPDPNTLSCHVTDSVYMQGTGIGTWSVASTSAGTVTFSNANSPTSLVSDFSTYGTYYLIFANTFGCKDTAKVVVSNSCVCPISNNAIYNPAVTSYCGSAPGILINGSYASPFWGFYRWEYSYNGGAFALATGDNNNRDYTTPALGVGTHVYRRKYATFWGVICEEYSQNVIINVFALPTIGNPNQSPICVDENTYILSSNIGTWTSSNPSVATITSGGFITGVSSGTTNFIFTNTATGCQNTSSSLIVNPLPVVSISATSVCYGNTVQASPSVGGVWNSSNSSISSIDFEGKVVTISSGSSYFIFTSQATGCSNRTPDLVILEKPIINFSGSLNLCLGLTKQLSSNMVGTWEAINPTIANITTEGLVNTVSQGIAKFVFSVTATGCKADTISMQVFGSPTVNVDYNGDVCFKPNMSISANAQGGQTPYSYSWTGPNGLTSSIPNLPISTHGNYYVTVVDQNGCSAASSGFVYQTYVPVIINPQISICEGQSTNLVANGSNNPNFSWSSNTGNAMSQQVTVYPQLPSSTYYVTVTNSLGCIAVATTTINVIPRPAVTVSGAAAICVGSTTLLSPGQGGIWVSLNSNIGTVNNSGLVTGVAGGQATFAFISNATGCQSLETLPITVYEPFTIANSGPSQLCIQGSTQLIPSTDGVWVSSSPTVASVTDAGVVTALAPGVVSFVFTNTTTGCYGQGNVVVIINPKPSSFISGDNPVCPGTTSTITPITGGTWTTSDATIATVQNNGVITAVNPGKATFIFVNGTTGCISDPSDTLTVLDKPIITLSGPTSICAGSTTQLISNTAGFWVSSNNSIASISNAGLVTGLNAGTVTIKFVSSTTGCESDASTSITVIPRPTINVTGSYTICIGTTTTLSPSTGGTWVSQNPSIAQISNSGVVTGISNGNVKFVFTSSATGCTSSPSATISVFPRPIALIAGPGEICVGSSVTLSPSTSGTWSSDNTSIAVVNNAGVVTGVSVGFANFSFIETSTGCSANSQLNIKVNPRPIVDVIGSRFLCIGGVTTLSPSTNGIWASNDPSIATVTNAGVVTAVSTGTTYFIFTTSTGCVSNPTATVSIFHKPIVQVSGPSTVCIGSNTAMLPNTGGTWVSGNPLVASITSTGIISANTPGRTKFVYTETGSGCVSDSSALITVNQKPTTSLIGAPQICIGSNTQFTPTNGGVWISNNPSIATINNAGLVTGISPGTATFLYSNATTTCQSSASATININARPTVGYTSSSTMCRGGTGQLFPIIGGTWVCLQPTIASVNNNGEIQGLQQGSVRFRFTDAATGCVANTSFGIVNERPSVYIDGPSTICIGGTSQLMPNIGGTWISDNPSVATVTAAGTIMGLNAGVTTFSFVDAVTGCSALSSVQITVANSSNILLSGSPIICVGYTSQLMPSDGGVWTSTDPLIASVNNNGLVHGLASGKVSFTFVQNETGCVTSLPDEVLDVRLCTDPDVNVGLIGYSITGSVSTNDDVPPGVFNVDNGEDGASNRMSVIRYGEIYELLSSPAGSVANISFANNGNYSFSATKSGIYEYNVSVCLGTNSTACPMTNLTVQIIDPSEPTTNMVLTTDFMTFPLYKKVIPDTLAIPWMVNDKCFEIIGCQLNSANMWLDEVPTLGDLYSYANNTNRYFISNGAMAGRDTMVYAMCDENDISICHKSKIYLMISAQNATNSIVAVDDFYGGVKDATITGNLLANDSDPEKNGISILTQGTETSPIIVPDGKYYINPDGSFAFTPNKDFIGNLSFAYMICDDNALDQACTQATVYFVVIDELKLRIRAYLEGGLVANKNAMSSQGKPLMRDDLRISPFTQQNQIPGIDPYSTFPALMANQNRFGHVGTSQLIANNVIHDSVNVFSVSGENAIVDWVFVEVRDKNDYTHLLATRSGLIQRDGDIVDLDGVSDLSFPELSVDSMYIAVKHRNHLGLMSMKIPYNKLVDFTLLSTPVFYYTDLGGVNYANLSGNLRAKPSYRALWAGDFDGNGKIKFINPGDDQNELFFTVFTHPANTSSTINFDFAYGYHNSDFNLDGKSKYDNPNDDKNMLFNQIIGFPLNVGFLSNFNFFVEQVPNILIR